MKKAFTSGKLKGTKKETKETKDVKLLNGVDKKSFKKGGK